MFSRIRKSMADKDQGFTLIELLVVIIIIGILAAIAIPVFLNQRKKGVDASMKSDLKNVATQMETYLTDKQVYPAAGAASTVTGDGVGTAGADFKANGQTINLTPGNTVLNVSAGAADGSFCLTVTSTAGNSGLLSYDSDKGGVLPLATPCSS